MTSEEIIERLLDEKKITVKEAMVILKDLAKENIKRFFYPSTKDIISYDPPVVCMYGVNTPNTSDWIDLSKIS